MMDYNPFVSKTTKHQQSGCAVESGGWETTGVLKWRFKIHIFSNTLKFIWYVYKCLDLPEVERQKNTHKNVSGKIKTKQNQSTK